MFEQLIAAIKNNRLYQFILVFFLGGFIATLFYPSKIIKKNMEKQFSQQISQLTQKQEQDISTLKSSYQAQISQLTETNKQLSVQVRSLTTQVSNLKNHKKTSYYKIVHPDGTVEIRASSEADSSQEQQISQEVQQEYKQDLQAQVSKLENIQAQQISTLQQQWDSKEQSYKDQISKLTKSESIVTSPKNFVVDGGVLTDSDYYVHIGYDVWGPFTIGIQTEFGATPALGAGIGLRF